MTKAELRAIALELLDEVHDGGSDYCICGSSRLRARGRWHGKECPFSHRTHVVDDGGSRWLPDHEGNRHHRDAFKEWLLEIRSEEVAP